jgi:hypothetical protein
MLSSCMPRCAQTHGTCVSASARTRTRGTCTGDAPQGLRQAHRWWCPQQCRATAAAAAELTRTHCCRRWRRQRRRGAAAAGLKRPGCRRRWYIPGQAPRQTSRPQQMRRRTAAVILCGACVALYDFCSVLVKSAAASNLHIFCFVRTESHLHTARCRRHEIQESGMQGKDFISLLFRGTENRPAGLLDS